MVFDEPQPTKLIAKINNIIRFIILNILYGTKM